MWWHLTDNEQLKRRIQEKEKAFEKRKINGRREEEKNMPERKLRMCHLEGKKEFGQTVLSSLACNEKKIFFCCMIFVCPRMSCYSILPENSRRPAALRIQLGPQSMALLPSSSLSFHYFPCHQPGLARYSPWLTQRREQLGLEKDDDANKGPISVAFFGTREKKSHKEFRAYPGKQAHTEQYEKGSSKRYFLSENLTKSFKLRNIEG